MFYTKTHFFVWHFILQQTLNWRIFKKLNRTEKIHLNPFVTGCNTPVYGWLFEYYDHITVHVVTREHFFKHSLPNYYKILSKWFFVTNRRLWNKLLYGIYHQIHRPWRVNMIRTINILPGYYWVRMGRIRTIPRVKYTCYGWNRIWNRSGLINKNIFSKTIIGCFCLKISRVYLWIKYIL